MTTLTATSHGGRIDAGDAVLTAAETTTTRPISARLARFGKAHRALAQASKALEVAERKLATAQKQVAEADVTQDESVDPLADALVGIGQPRKNPFTGLSPHSPSRLKELGYDAEATAVLKLVAKVRARKKLPTPVTAACATAERAANAVRAAIVPIAALTKDVTAARTRRDALTQPWETSFSALKRAARSADDDGAGGLYDALFRATTAPTRRQSKPRATKTPAPTPPPV